MKITSIEPILIELPYEHGAPKPSHGSGAVRTNMEAVYLRVDTDAGVTGWGEAFGFAACPITLEAVKLVVAPLAVGRDADDIPALMTDLFRRTQGMSLNGPVRFALSGLDIALWDIAGKVAGEPIHRLLGGDGARTRIPTYASLLRIGDPDDVSKVAGAAVERGYRHIKLHERTVDAVSAARDAVGDDVALMLDTNCTWNVDQAVEMALRMALYDLAWLEEPVSPPDDFAALARVRREGGIPVAAGENLGTVNDVRRIVEAEAVDIVQPDAAKIGGITEIWKAVEFAESRGVRVEPHSPLYGPALIATLHVIAAMRTDAMCEFFYCDLAASPMGDAIMARDGYTAVPQGPGLGVEIDEDVIAQYRVG